MVSHASIIADTKAWLLHAVIGLNLCPFAKSVHIKNQIEYRISEARDNDTLLQDLLHALQSLNQTDPATTDTTLLIHPWVLQDFYDYNDFLGLADDALDSLGLTGTIQIASFHPDYQFAGTDAADITNCTNRSPFPMLHLLREDSLERAISAMPDANEIVDRNLDTVRKLGAEGWQHLQDRIRQR